MKARRPRLLAMLWMVSSGCRRDPPSAKALPVLEVHAAAPSTSSTSSTPPTPLSFACAAPVWPRALVGELGAGNVVLVRLAVVDGKLRGRYLYQRIGKDLDLSGSFESLDAGGNTPFELRESVGSTVTGTFTGTCDSSAHVLSGHWRAGSRALDFTLRPVERPYLVKKTQVVRGKGAGGACRYEEFVHELFSPLGNAVDARLSHQGLESARGPWLHPEIADDAKKCETSFEGTFGESVLESVDGIFSIWRDGAANYKDTAHPLNSGEWVAVEHDNVDLRTGQKLAFSEVFARSPKSIVERCVDLAASSCAEGPELCLSAAQWKEKLHPDEDFVLLPRGVRFFASNFEHARGYFNFAGPTIPYAVLLREGVLHTDGPAARLWRRLPPSSPGAPPCPLSTDGWWPSEERPLP